MWCLVHRPSVDGMDITDFKKTEIAFRNALAIQMFDTQLAATHQVKIKALKSNSMGVATAFSFKVGILPASFDERSAVFQNTYDAIKDSSALVKEWQKELEIVEKSSVAPEGLTVSIICGSHVCVDQRLAVRVELLAVSF